MTNMSRSPQNPNSSKQNARTERFDFFGSIVGWIAGIDSELGIQVDFEGNPGAPLPALSTVSLKPEELREAIAERRGVVLLFERNHAERPLLIGLVQPPPAEGLLDLIVDGVDPVEARVDGERVVIEGRDEVVLRCGNASIVMRRDGRIVVRGTEVVSHSTGTNRIRGGSVRIN